MTSLGALPLLEATVVQVRAVVSNVVGRIGLEAQITALLADLGYSLPLEEAYRAFEQALGLTEPLPPTLITDPSLLLRIEEAVADVRRTKPNTTIKGAEIVKGQAGLWDWFMRESSLRDRFFESSPLTFGSLWTSFCRLKSARGFCIVQLLYTEHPYGPPQALRQPVNPPAWPLSNEPVTVVPTRETRVLLSILAEVNAQQEFGYIQEALASRIEELSDWTDYTPLHKHFVELRRSTTLLALTGDQIAISERLGEKRLRQMLQIIGRARQDQFQLQRQFLAKYTPQDADIDGMIATLVALGLAQRSDETSVLSITKLGRNLLDKSRWMTDYLVGILQRIGVERDRILVEVPYRDGESDAFVAVGNELLMLDLKDGPYDRGHADRFVGRVREHKPTQAIIWTTEGVSPSAREYFRNEGLGVFTKVIEHGAERFREPTLVLIERFEDLEPTLAEIVNTLHWQAIEEMLRPLTRAATLPMSVPQAMMAALGKPPDAVVARVESGLTAEDKFIIQYRPHT